MCLVAFAFNSLPDGGTLIAANRDEFHARPTRALAAWPDAPHLFAGRDVQAGGTWMGMSANGRYGFVTNYRDPARVQPTARSRGDLVEDFLRGDEAPASYLQAVQARGALYNGFNLVLGDARQAWYYSNMDLDPRALAPGVYLLSNHLLDSPWPKALRLRARLADMQKGWRAGGLIDAGALTSMMKDGTVAPDEQLPRTGIALARERMLSSPFIVSPDYGTRSTAIICMPRGAAAWMAETRYRPDASVGGATLITPRRHPDPPVSF